MGYNPAIHHRRSIRLRGWDYASCGGYFVTIVVKPRKHFFGNVMKGEMQLSALGVAADECWREIPHHHERVSLDAHVIMPDHVHGIVVIEGGVSKGEDKGADTGDEANGDQDKGVQLNAHTPNAHTLNTHTLNAHTLNAHTLNTHTLNTHTLNAHTQLNAHTSDLISPAKGSLSVIIRTYKAAVTTWARRNGYEEFGWLGRFYEHIIRNEEELGRIRKYIEKNPRKWKSR